MKKPTLATLAVAIAAGQSIASWCRETGGKKRSAYRMAKTPECRRLVQEIRRRAVDKAIGRLARHAAKSVDQIVRLSSSAESEAVRLSAARAVLADLLAVQGHAELEREIREIRERLGAQEERRAKRNH